MDLNINARAVILVLWTLFLAGKVLAASPESKYPSKPNRWVVPSSAGGGNDALARLFGAKMTQNWGQQVIVDIRPGASGIIGSEIVAKAAPDGYTLLIVASGYALNAYVKTKLPYDTLNDFERVTIITYSPNVLVVHPSVPLRSVKELIAFAKAKPNALNYASSGTGTISFLSAVSFMTRSGTSLVEVPYKGAGDAGRAVLSGEVHVNFNAPSVTVPLIKAGRLRGLGVTSPQRMRIIPDVPAIAETLPGYELQNFFGLVVPAKTPRAIIDKLRAEIVRILALPDVRENVEQQGFVPAGNTPDEFTAYVRDTIVEWSKLLKESGIKPE